jgi:hypothetical protein
MAEPTEQEIEAELASILRRSPDDPERQALEAELDGCEVMTLYARTMLPTNGVACEPRKCDECGELFTPANDPGALCCSKECRRKEGLRRVLANRELLAYYRQRYPAEYESQPVEEVPSPPAR